MKKIVQISFPRSGTQILQFLLLTYFSKNLYFPAENYNTKKLILNSFIKNNPLVNDKYRSLESFLKEFLKQENTYYIKNIVFSHIENNSEEVNYVYGHDIDNLLINPDYFYIIQYRHPILSALSLVNYNINKDTITSIRQEVQHWQEFIQKWMNVKFYNNVLFIRYVDLIKNPKKYLRQILNKIDYTINIRFLNKVIEIHNLEVQHTQENILQNPYIKTEYFDILKEIELSAEKEMKLLHIERMFK